MSSCSLQPQICHQTSYGFFWWALNIEDPALNDNSKYEVAGMETNDHLNARDRNIKLQWAPLKYMLSVIATVDRNKDLYKKDYYVQYAEHVTFSLLPGGVIQPAIQPKGRL